MYIGLKTLNNLLIFLCILIIFKNSNRIIKNYNLDYEMNPWPSIYGFDRKINNKDQLTKIYKDKEVTKSGDNESFYAKLTEYKVIIVMFFLYIFDWLSSLFAIIFVHLKFMLDQEESYFQKDVPTQACKHSCKH